MGKLSLFNPRGDPLCHWYGCGKRTRLQTYDNALLCNKHIKEAATPDYEKHLKTSDDPVSSSLCKIFGKCQKCTKTYPLTRIIGGKWYCADHVELNRLSQYDQGQRLCDWIGCFELGSCSAFNGFFCHEHTQKYAKIRGNITHTGSAHELMYRQIELNVRKSTCDRHIDYYVQLQHQLNSIQYDAEDGDDPHEKVQQFQLNPSAAPFEP